MHLGKFACAVSALLWLAACETMPVDRTPSAVAEKQYDAFFPYYAELCAVSEFKKKPGFGADISSGIGGHSVFYLNGVCRDESAHYPAIELCDASVPAAKRGVGLSVNAHYKNANWVATEGRDFFFHGTLGPGERLTRAAYQETLSRAKEMGILDGVIFHTSYFDDMPAGMSARDYKYEISVATDYAVQFGRDRYCARVPLERNEMEKVVAFLNGLNAPYRDGRKEFDWNTFQNNCSHLAHNALAAAGIWDVWPTERFLLIAALDFPVPKNEFVNLMRRTNDTPIEDPLALYQDEAARRALDRGLRLATRPGALAEAEPVIHDNDVYDTDLRLIFYDDPILDRYQKRFDRIFAEKRYFDLEANLRHFASLYAQIERERPALAALLAVNRLATADERKDFATFYELYYRYVARERAEVGAELASLKGTPPSSTEMTLSQSQGGQAYRHSPESSEGAP